MRILFLSRWYPYPPDNGSKIRIFNLIRHLASRHEVHLISFTSEGLADKRLDAIHQYCRGLETVLHRPYRPDALKAWLGFLSARPRYAVEAHSAEMAARVEERVRRSRFDVVIASQLDMAPYARPLAGPTKIFEEVELTVLYDQFARQRQLSKKLRYGLTWWKLSRYVANLLQGFDGCTVVSEVEGERARQILRRGLSIGVVPNGVDTDFYSGCFGAPQADTLVYSGALTYAANFDAMVFFLREIFPLIRAERPNVRLVITGALDGVPVHRLPHREGVTLTGYLDDVRPAVAQSWVSIVPLRIGGGTRLKLLEASSLGTPVVATRKGAEGLELTPDHDLLIADAPADFAAAVVRVLRDPDLRTALSRNGRQAVEAKYDWRTIGRRFLDFVEHAAASKALPAPPTG
jgi:sugar transferase (PEP-CTERM/EpsH1 system associated)